MNMEGLDKWRNFFKGVNGSIFEIIETAIKLAAKDHPDELKLRREQIAEKIYSSGCARRCGNDQLDLTQSQKPKHDNLHEEQKEIQVNRFSHSDAEALLDEIDDENEAITEVLRIKQVLCNSADETKDELLESLRRLRLMNISTEILLATEIGVAVNKLQSHISGQISQFARGLIVGWKKMAGEWYDAKAALRGCQPVQEEEAGLPLPPLDDLDTVFATQTPMELTKFFDGLDDNGNLQDPQMVNDNARRTKFRKYTNPRSNPIRIEHSNQVNAEETPQEKMLQGKMKNQASFSVNSDKPSAKKHLIEPTEKATNTKDANLPNNESGLTKRRRLQDTTRLESSKAVDDHENEAKVILLGRPSSKDQQQKYKHLDEAEIQEKFETTKRKLHEGYQHAEDARKKRTTQFVDLHELPKKGPGNGHPQPKEKNQNQQKASGKKQRS